MRPQKPQIWDENDRDHEISLKKMYQCHYCREYFTPKRRFVQKYCSESCRVMAFRERNEARNSSGTDLHENRGQKNENLGRKTENTHAKNKNQINLDEILEYLKKRDKEIDRKLSSISNNQQLLMVINSLLPFIADPIKEKFAALRAGNQKTATKLPSETELLQKLAPLLGNLSPEIKAQIMNLAGGMNDVKK